MLKMIGERLSSTSGPILDLGCGYGRNALTLALRGYQVVAADNELQRLEVLKATQHRHGHIENEHRFGSIQCVRIDALKPSWPFAENIFGGVVCVHFPNFNVVIHVHKYIKAGGIFYFESVPAHGKNYLQLPPKGWIRDLLEENFRFVHYEEKLAGPRDKNAVTVRFLAIRI